MKLSSLSTAGSQKEVDILDLERPLAETSNPDIIHVLDNLLRGSENHVRGFVSQAGAAGVERPNPVLMDQTAYDEILTSEAQRGGSSDANHGQGEWHESGEDQHGRECKVRAASAGADPRTRTRTTTSG